jgi:hypothetical protein
MAARHTVRALAAAQRPDRGQVCRRLDTSGHWQESKRRNAGTSARVIAARSSEAQRRMRPMWTERFAQLPK